MKTKIILLCTLIFGVYNAQNNIIKTNISSIALNNYSLQYERIISKHSSFAIQVRYMPQNTLPMQNNVKNILDENDDDAMLLLETTELGNFAITPEYRFYVGKGLGKGFYFAPYYRYAKFEVDNAQFTFTNDLGFDEKIKAQGSLTSHSFGLMLGAQWEIVKNFMLDWWIIGAAAGTSNGTFDAITNRTLSATEQAQLKKELEDLDLQVIDKEITTNANGATIKTDGAFYGIRAGISLGLRF